MTSPRLGRTEGFEHKKVAYKNVAFVASLPS